MALSERYRLWRKREDGSDFMVCAMFTPDYRHFAERLLKSLNRYSISHALYEVPQIYHSISPKGGTDPEFSKPHFIRNLLRQFERPILYSDADLIFRKEPELLTRLCAEGCDFATYNWLADPMNDAWRPEPGWRLWKFYFRVDLMSDTQLMASGGVQLWSGTPAAFRLLDGWEQSLQRHPQTEDDHCLDFAYNLSDHRPHARLVDQGICAPAILDLCRSGDRPSGISHPHHWIFSAVGQQALCPCRTQACQEDAAISTRRHRRCGSKPTSDAG